MFTLSYGFIKIIIITGFFLIVRKLNIPDNYKFLLTILPSILILSFNKIITNYKYKNSNKPIFVKKNDFSSDTYLVDDYFFENFENQNFFINNDLNAKLIEVDSPFWIEKGFFDISNPNNFIRIKNLSLNNNYTLEFWLKLKYISNDNILCFYNKNKLILKISYDEKFIYINKTKIPIVSNNWFHFVIMRGKHDTLGSNKGYLYINGIFYSYIENLPNLSNITDGYFFKTNSTPLEYNKKYNDISNCSVIRIYNRSLTLDEIQNNYLKDASYYELEELDDIERTYVKDNTLIFYLEPRINIKPNNSSFSQNSMERDWLQLAQEYKIQKKVPRNKANKVTNKEKKNELVTTKPIFI